MAFLPRPDKCRLREVIGQCVVANQSPQHAANHALMKTNQSTKGLAIVCRRRPHKLALTDLTRIHSERYQ